MKQMKYIVVDFDNTLSDDLHRREHIDANDWDKYHGRLGEDRPHKDVADTLHIMSGTVSIIILTARPERYRKHSTDWLFEHEIPFDYLLMREDGDDTDSAILKITQLERFFDSKEMVLKKVLFALEDRDKVVKAFREYGIPTWQVREGGF